MAIIEKHKNLSARFFDAISSFAVLTVILLFIVVLLRLFELAYNLRLHTSNLNVAKLFGSVLVTDLLFWFKFSALLLVVYLPVYIVSHKAAKGFFITASLFFTLLQLSLSQYFSQALVPLGADIYGYSKADMIQTIGASGHVSITIIAFFIIFVICCVSAFWFFPGKIQLGRKFSFSLVLLTFFCVTLSSFIVVPQSTTGSEFINNLALNKTDFFLAQSIHHFFPEENEIDIYSDAYIGDYGNGPSSISNFEYVDQLHFPFLHKENAQDVLSPFFKSGSQKPNIVILLVEGLGRAFTNGGAYLGNFTPFIDSLSGKSLYWENFLSEGGRTFAVLPSVLGSLPFLKNGFAEMGDQMPRHLSLINLLKYNGYRTAFYYGGDSKFDNMQLFLKKSGIDEIKDEATFSPAYAKMPGSTSGFTWGYGDKELFKRYFEIQTTATDKPSLNVILTVSTHTPFLIDEQQLYLDKFETRMQQLGFDETKKKEYRDYKFQYASILYTDDAVKNFIHLYASRPDFNNTIFFITGDHRMPEIPMASKIDRYHVPLIIYSPMLARTAKFSSVSTHFDITPSILAYLKTNFQLQLPSLVSWMGSGLDTTRSFNNAHAYPLLQTKSELNDFLAGSNLLNNQQLFELKEGLQSTTIEDGSRVTVMQHSFDEFKRKNVSVINGAALLPDSILNHYFSR